MRPSRALSSTNYPLGRLSMNLVGKIFVVLIFVMSVVFMAFAMAVYATHKNWREVVAALAGSGGPSKQLGLEVPVEEGQGQQRGAERRVRTS